MTSPEGAVELEPSSAPLPDPESLPLNPRRRNPIVAAVLTLLLGPLGMLYSTVRGAIYMLVAGALTFLAVQVVLGEKAYHFPAALETAGATLVIVSFWLACVYWAVRACDVTWDPNNGDEGVERNPVVATLLAVVFGAFGLLWTTLNGFKRFLLLGLLIPIAASLFNLLGIFKDSATRSFFYAGMATWFVLLLVKAWRSAKPTPYRVVAARVFSGNIQTGAQAKAGDAVFSSLARAAGGLVVALVVAIGAYLLYMAIPALQNNHVNFFTSSTWAPGDTESKFGIAQMLYVTVVTSIIALGIAVPVGIGVALFLTFYSPSWLAKPAATVIDLLSAVPSIVYGVWGLFVAGPAIAPFLEWLSEAGTSIGLGFLFRNVGGTSVESTIIFVSIVLAIMVLPIITALSREVFAQTPRAHQEGALALGATKWEMIRTAVLPFGKPGVISASMLALGRALGETVAVLIILSTTADSDGWTWSLFHGGTTFASKIASGAAELDTKQSTGAYISAGLVLFILTFVVNATARMIIARRKEFTE